MRLGAAQAGRARRHREERLRVDPRGSGRRRRRGNSPRHSEERQRVDPRGSRSRRRRENSRKHGEERQRVDPRGSRKRQRRAGSRRHEEGATTGGPARLKRVMAAPWSSGNGCRKEGQLRGLATERRRRLLAGAAAAGGTVAAAAAKKIVPWKKELARKPLVGLEQDFLGI
ncbi:hypothetical protein CLOP_g14005 [Closterium sp. NIES-67]|nr:hypothetical protein CLOP_g14005 [Closterium sp. NIES-67]